MGIKIFSCFSRNIVKLSFSKRFCLFLILTNIKLRGWKFCKWNFTLFWTFYQNSWKNQEKILDSPSDSLRIIKSDLKIVEYHLNGTIFGTNSCFDFSPSFSHLNLIFHIKNVSFKNQFQTLASEKGKKIQQKRNKKNIMDI